MGYLNSPEANRFLHPKSTIVWGARVGVELLSLILVDLRFPDPGPLHVDELVAEGIS